MTKTPAEFRASHYNPQPRSWWPALVLTLVVVCGATYLLHSCDPREGPAPVIDAAAPEASTPPAPSVPPDTPVVGWEPVRSLPGIAGIWVSGGDRAEVTSRRASKKWRIPYPWRLQLRTGKYEKPWDCGFYEKIHTDWRVGFCLGGKVEGNVRAAHRVVFHTNVDRPGELRVSISGEEAVILHTGKKRTNE